MKYAAQLLGLAALALAAPSSDTHKTPKGCPLPSSYNWTGVGPLTQPKHDLVSLKDFTTILYKGKHLVYASATDRNQSYFSVGTGLFKEWKDFKTTTQTIAVNRTVAPTLFYFRPKDVYVLAFQYGAVPFNYQLSKDPSDVNGWGEIYPLFNGTDPSAPYNILDQTLIGDDKDMYLFFAGDNGKIYRHSIPIGDFPGFFGTQYEVILEEPIAEDLYEAVQVYTIAGGHGYLMIVECVGVVGRYFKSFTATSLDGAWTAQKSTESDPFAGKSNVAVSWTDDISHGDLVRFDNDQRQLIDACNLQMLHQGLDPNSRNVSYNLLPYRPGLITLNKPGPSCHS